MNFERDPSNTDEYFVTALQIFDCCGVESTESLHVDALMDKFTPFVKANKAEFSFLKTLLDPEHSNPVINVTKLAKALHQYSESQKTKVDLEESFNLKTGQAPQDSDSGISTDGMSGLQLLEELQCSLKEKEHLALQLRSQLDFTDRQHEEQLALTAERDSLRRHLNMVREENAALSQIRNEYEEACERLNVSDAALGAAKRELDTMRRRYHAVEEQVVALDTDKLTLQELLAKSKDECHRINEMYATRQSALLEENETLKTEHADLTSRFQDQEEFMQQIIKEKVLLEMELKDLLNKSNQSHFRLDRSIDVSYTEEQMLTALDSINADTRFAPENRILDEESFLSALKEDHGRSTNMSLFDEIRLSFCNVTRHNITGFNTTDKWLLDTSAPSNNTIVTTGTQTDDLNEIRPYSGENKAENCIADSPVKERYEKTTVGTQTDKTPVEIKPYRDDTEVDNYKMRDKCNKMVACAETQTDELNIKPSCDTNKAQNRSDKAQLNVWTQTIGGIIKMRPFNKGVNIQNRRPKVRKTAETQTDDIEPININNNVHDCVKCLECVSKAKVERVTKFSNPSVSEMENEIAQYEENLEYLQKLITDGKDKNSFLHSVVEELKAKIDILEAACEKQSYFINTILSREVHCVECQTDIDQSSVSTQVEVPCAECVKRTAGAVVPHRLRKFFWEPIKCLFQMFAVICFICAVCVLCGVAKRGTVRCEREGGALPWRWLHAQDLMDLLLRIEYTSDVPM